MWQADQLVGQRAGRNEAGEGGKGQIAHGGPIGHSKDFVLNLVLNKEPLDSRQSVVMIFVSLKDHCAAMGRIKLAEVVQEAGRDHVGSNCTGPG